MKKITFSLVLALSTLLCVTGLLQAQSNAGEQPGLPAENAWIPMKYYMTMTDIDEKEYDMRAQLESGKAILFEVCGYWSYSGKEIHTAGKLEQLYNKYDEKGTKELSIVWLNMDSCDVEVLRGAFDYTTYEQFDWTNGGTIPYPLINSSRVHKELNFPIWYAPRFYFITPSGYFADITDMIKGDAYMEQMEELMNKEMRAKTAPSIVDIRGVSPLYVGEKGYFKPLIRSNEPISKIEWSLDGVNFTEGEIYQPLVAEAGNKELTLRATNAEGVSTKTFPVEVLPAKDAIRTYPQTFDMEDTRIPAALRNLDADEDGYSWTLLNQDFTDRLGGALSPDNGSHEALLSYSYYIYLVEWDNPVLPIGFSRKHSNWLISAPITIADNATQASMSWNDSYLFEADPDNVSIDGYKVLISTTDVNPESFTTTAFEIAHLPLKTEDERFWNRKIDLSAYKGQTIYVAFVHDWQLFYAPDMDGSGIILDDIQFESDGVLYSLMPKSKEAQLYPTPAEDHFMVRAEDGSEVSVFTLGGDMIYHNVLRGAEESISCGAWPAGSYVVKVVSPNGTTQVIKQIVE